MFDVVTTTTITAEQVADLMTGAMEGGSGYWIESIDPRYAKHEDYSEAASYGRLMKPRIFHTDDIDYVFGFTEIEKGLQCMSRNYPQDFANIIDDNADAETSDVFLQCALFGRIVYG